jgi:ferredoxin
MSSSDHKISRRNFLGKATKTGVVLSSVGRLSVAHGAPEPETTDTKPYRYIDPSRCIGCGQCVPLCPMGAISLDGGKSSIDPDECTECSVCRRSRICPADAIQLGDLKWPRVLRATFSDPLAEHKATGVGGRGTEGIKTNDSQHRYERGSMGVFVELGRPVLGARFRDVERVVKKFKTHGYDVPSHNPVSELIADPTTGALKPEILNEKVISCLVEFLLPENASGELMGMVRELAGEVETVFNVSVALRAADGGQTPLTKIFRPDVFSLPNGKVNIGMALDIEGEEV